ncbi:hypothetical protein D3C86_1774400 [compost metagenome]
MKLLTFSEIGLFVAAATSAPSNNKANPMCETAAPASLRFPPNACANILALDITANTQLNVSKIYIRL